MTIDHAGDNHHVDPWDSGAGSGFLGGGVAGGRWWGGRGGRFLGAEAAAQARSRRVRVAAVEILKIPRFVFVRANVLVEHSFLDFCPPLFFYRRTGDA